MKNSLRMQRAIKNITQADLVKVSRQTINTMESGKYILSTALALKIAAVFGVPVEQVFELEEDSP